MDEFIEDALQAMDTPFQNPLNDKTPKHILSKVLLGRQIKTKPRKYWKTFSHVQELFREQGQYNKGIPLAFSF